MGKTGAGAQENGGREGYGRREKKRQEAGEKLKKRKLSSFVTAYHPVKETTPTTFLDFQLTFSEA